MSSEIRESLATSGNSSRMCVVLHLGASASMTTTPSARPFGLEKFHLAFGSMDKREKAIAKDIIMVIDIEIEKILL